MISNKPIGKFGKNPIYGLDFEFPERTRKIRAVCKGNSGQIVEIAEAYEIDSLVEHLRANCKISPTVSRSAYRKRVDYKRRFIEAEAWNEEQRKAVKGLLRQVIFENVIYSVTGESAQRVVSMNPDEDRVNPAFYSVFAQLTTEPDPDAAYLWEQACDSELAAALIISQEIQKQVLKTLLPEQL